MPDDSLKPGDDGYVEPTEAEQALAALKEENEGLKQTAEMQVDQINLYKANQRDPTPQVSDQGSQEFQGMEDNDVITVSDLKKIMGGQEQKYGGVITELEFKTQHADFDKVIQSYLPELVKGRPDLAKALRSSGNPALLAYELVTSSEKYIKDAAEGKLEGVQKAVEDAAKIAENAGKPAAASGAAGGGAGNNSVDYFLKLSDDDLEAHIANIKRKE